MTPFAETLNTNASDVLIAGLATLSRYDLATKCIESLLAGSRVPDKIIVVDNGGGFTHRFGSVVVVHDLGRHVGVSASLNMIRLLANGNDCLFLNDDIFVGPETVRRMVETPGWFVTALRFGCFLVREPLFARIGTWDEQFWPAYYDDFDFLVRMQIEIDEQCELGYSLPIEGLGLPPGVGRHPGGMLMVDDPSVVHFHGGSQTRSPWMERHIEQNRIRFETKWDQIRTREYWVWDYRRWLSHVPYLNAERMVREQ